jgi:hypothetical protein
MAGDSVLKNIFRNHFAFLVRDIARVPLETPGVWPQGERLLVVHLQSSNGVQLYPTGVLTSAARKRRWLAAVDGKMARSRIKPIGLHRAMIARECSIA